MNHPPSTQDLRALPDKYERMLSLRAAHERARVEPGWVEPDPRAAMAKLADDFPGALREIDVLEIHVITARIDALANAERSPSAVEAWMQAQALFHRLMRGALATKRWLRGRRRITSEIRAELIRAIPTLPRGGDATLLLDDLDRVANPPRGRLLVVVHARLAEMLGLTEAEVRLLVTPVHARPKLGR